MNLTDKNNYYAVIFTSVRLPEDSAGYANMSKYMQELAQQQAGFLGIDSARQDIGITVSYWESLDAIKEFKAQYDHQMAQKFGREKWYLSYTVRICQVLKEYSFHK